MGILIGLSVQLVLKPENGIPTVGHGIAHRVDLSVQLVIMTANGIPTVGHGIVYRVNKRAIFPKKQFLREV